MKAPSHALNIRSKTMSSALLLLTDHTSVRRFGTVGLSSLNVKPVLVVHIGGAGGPKAGCSTPVCAVPGHIVADRQLLGKRPWATPCLCACAPRSLACLCAAAGSLLVAVSARLQLHPLRYSQPQVGVHGQQSPLSWTCDGHDHLSSS